MDEPYIDPYHRVPDEQWAQVREDAQKFRTESDESEVE